MDINIRYMRTSAPLLAPVFRSEGQARILSAILVSGHELSLSELATRADVAYASAHREVRRLIDAGILREQRVGRTRVISANPDSPLTSPLRQILLISTGPVVLLSEAFARIEGVQRAFIYGSFAARAQGISGADPKDIDVMVIGTPQADAVYDACAAVEPKVGRPVNPTILSLQEWNQESGFLDEVRRSPMIPIVGVDA